jgi:hypothetical protein
MIAVDENLCGIRLPALRGDIVCDVSTVSLVLAGLDADLYAGSQYGAARPLTCISVFLFRCASQYGVLEREGYGWSPPNTNHQCGSETRQAGATLVPNARIDNTGRTLF